MSVQCQVYKVWELLHRLQGPKLKFLRKNELPYDVHTQLALPMQQAVRDVQQLLRRRADLQINKCFRSTGI